MPNRIWAGAYPEDTEAGAWSLNQEFESDDKYIRADISEELALAMLRLIDGGCYAEAEEAYAKYKEATK